MKARKKAGWRVNGYNIYHVKGKTKSRRKTFKTKAAARRYIKRRRRGR